MREERKEGGLSLAGDSVSDVRQINPGLFSGLPSYITDKWAPLPRARQDVAGEEE